jgi:hypothetical protein
MERIVTTKPIVGICHMQVCAEADVTDEEILEHCNTGNPSGTMNGWSSIVRSPENMAPVVCKDDPARLHFMVAC